MAPQSKSKKVVAQAAITTPTSTPESPQQRMMYQGIEYEYAGPLPHPNILAQYEEVLPGIAERMMVMAEKMGEHRRELERAALNAEIEDTHAQRRQIRFGQICGLIISCVAIVGGCYVAISKSPAVGGIISCSGIGGLVSVFIWGPKKADEPSQTDDATPTTPDD